MDIETVVRAQNGDRAAFTALAEGIGGRFHAAAYSILRDRGLAEDATQQALVDVWRGLPKLRDPGRFDAWAYRLLVNSCYAQSRSERRWIRGLSAARPEPIAVDDLGNVVDRDQLERAFRDLSIEQRTVIVLRHLLGLRLGEIAEAVDAPVETVRSRLRAALTKMRAAIDADTRAPSGGAPIEGVPAGADQSGDPR